jgi:uncharacterized protein YceH (UPF0502 family)
VSIDLTPNEARVLGCLMEKSVITPENYPLSLNALVNACNQKSSRDPVLSLEPGVVQRTLNELVAKSLVTAPNIGGRVDKYQQCFCNTHFATIKLTPAEFAIMCLLLLRGPQTPGELKAHSGRLHEFADPAEVDAALEVLMTRADGPLVARLPREPRRKDHTYAHLLSGPIASVAVDPDRSEMAAPRVSALAELEGRVAKLEESLAALKRALGVE